MKAICMVAHPDDCVIFGYSFIHNHPEYQWTICYLTYTANDPRGQEFVNFWGRRNCNTKFLGYVDNWHDIENGHISFNEDSAYADIQSAIADCDLVLTHNAEGDYGHIHHVFVNRATANHPKLVTFAGPGQGTVKYTIEPGVYSLDEFPLHQEIVAGFHPTTHTNEYKL
jgi:LmbE family N-acetylglucosaminyl deacetylase